MTALSSAASSRYIAEFFASRLGLGKEPNVFAITGAAALGKSTLAANVKVQLEEKTHNLVTVLSTDSFLIDRRTRAQNGLNGYDVHATDIQQLVFTVEQLLSGNPSNVPIYDHVTGTISARGLTLDPAPILLLEGIHSLHQRLRPYVHASVFLDTDHKTCINMKVTVDSTSRGYTQEDALRNAEGDYAAYLTHIAPYRPFADLVLGVIQGWCYEVRGVL